MASFDVDIEKIVAGGDGLARHEGRVVFVPKTAPGERHRVETVQEKKDYVRAASLSCLEASVSRRAAPCTYYERCGGCSLMHLTPEAQLDAKKNILLESLTRGGGFGSDDVRIHATPSPEQGYRTRLRFHVSHAGDRLVMGFRQRKSHEVEDVEHCRLGGDHLNASWRRIRRYFHEDTSRARGLESIELQESSHQRGRIIGRFLVRSRDAFRRFDRASCDVLLGASSLDGAVVVSGSREVRVGEPYVHHRVEGLTLRQSSGAFFQTNRFLLDKLVELAAPDEPTTRLVDLYCGVGLLSLPYSPLVGDIVGVESSAVAVADATANAKAAGVKAALFVRADAARFAEGFRFSESDYVIVDPPRGGLPRELRATLAASPLRRLCYVACDPAAFGRDAAWFRDHGFRLDRLDLLDFFPNTHHFETVAAFSRDGVRSPGDAALDSDPHDG